MKISEITQQTSEGWLDTVKSYIAKNTGNKESAYVLGFTGALDSGFKQGLRVAGVKKGAQTSEDLAEYLMSAGINQEVVKKAFQDHFPQGFQEVPASVPDKTGPDYSQYDDNKGTAKDRKDAEAEKAGVDPNQGDMFSTRRYKADHTPGKPLAKSKDDTIDLSGTGFKNESLIAEAGTKIPFGIVNKVIRTALQHQSRIGSGLNKVQIPGNAQQPSVSAQAMFQTIEKEIKDGDPTSPMGDQSVQTIAAQIRSLSDEQRAALTTTLQQPAQAGVKVPADAKQDSAGN